MPGLYPPMPVVPPPRQDEPAQAGLLARGVDALGAGVDYLGNAIGGGVQALREGDQALARNLNDALPVQLFPVPEVPDGTMLDTPAPPEAPPAAPTVGVPPMLARDGAGGPPARPPAPVAARAALAARAGGAPAAARAAQAAGSPAPAPMPLQSPEELAAAAARKKAGEGEIEATRAATKVKTDQAGELLTETEAQQKAEAEANAWAETARGEAKAALAAARDEIRKFHPTELFEGREAARVGSWIAAGIGQFASAMGGGPNTALQVLEGATERWAAKERERYGRLVQSGQMAAEDMELAETEIRNKMIGIREGFANRRATILAKFAGPQAAAEGDAVIAGLQKQNAIDEQKNAEVLEKRLIDRRDMARQELLAGSTVELQKAQGEAARANAAESRANAARARAAAAGGNAPPAEMVVVDPGGRPLGVSTTTPKAAADARESVVGRAKFHAAADKLIKEITDNAGVVMGGEAKSRMEALRGELLGAARSALYPGGGSIDEGFVKLLENMVPDATSVGGRTTFNTTMVAKLNQSKQAVDRETRSKLAAAGIPPERLDPRGR